MYSSGLFLTAALTLNQNPFFEIGSSIVIEMGRTQHIAEDMQYSYDSGGLHTSGGISQLNSHLPIPISPKA